MNNAQKRHVLLLYKDMIPSVRLCGHCQLEYLAGEGLVDYRPRSVTKVRKDDLNWADMILCVRLDNIYEMEIAQEAKLAGKRIIYVIDDDLLHVPADLTSGAYYANKKIRTGISGLIDLSDAIISPSLRLLDKYAGQQRTRIFLEEPAIAPIAYRAHEEGKPIRIGFAGSVDRTGDIEQILKDALLRIRNEYGARVEFVFFGAVPSFAADLHAQCIPYCASYDAYRQTLNDLHLDIGLAPMPATDFHACKHYNKFVEYAAAGAVGIFSDVPPYDRIRTQFGWELLCRNSADEWFHAIKQLIDDPLQLEALRLKLARLCENEFSIPVISRSLYSELAALPLSESTVPVRIASLTWIKVRMLFSRVVNGVRRYGFKAPAVIIRKIADKLK